ncbi:MAG: tetratricopeptide repeat protein [Myxococcota bacterium]|jgi:TolA-binding protein|nr:tetratricopeptide repeat protein [Myxococcota bacterium]
MTDECHRFDEALLDLCYAELSECESEPLREHASRCPRCRGELESLMLVRRLSKRLPQLEPPAAIDDAILAAARKQALQMGPQSSEARLGIERAPSFAQTLQRFFLRPALVLSATTALVAVGAYVILRMDPDMAGENGAPPSVALRESPPEIPHSAGSEPAPPSIVPPASESPLPQDEGLRSRSSARALEPAAPSRLGTSAGGPPAASGAPSPSHSAADPPEAVRRATSKAVADEELDTRARQRRYSEQAKGKADTASSAPLLRQALIAYQRGDCESARPSLQIVANDIYAPPTSVATSLHYLARCEKRQGSCGKAVALYRRLLRDHSGYPGRVDALQEAAECHRKLGQTQEAATLLEERSAILGNRE